MNTRRLYCPDLSRGTNELSPDESHHAISALRMSIGETVTLFDGAGREADGTVSRVERRALAVDVTEIRKGGAFDAPLRLTLAVGMPKAHRQGYLVEKCTELGVAAIQPILTERSVARPTSTATGKWSRRAIEAAKQAHRRWLPSIEAPITFDELTRRADQFDRFGIADLGPEAEPATRFAQGMEDGACVLAAVGPEGGWTDSERDLAVRAGARVFRLGATVLRTETAAAAVCAVLLSVR